MFNLLLDTLPTSVLIDEIEYKINSDFRTSILFEMLIEDDELTKEEKFFSAIDLYFDVIPQDLEKATDKLLEFYKGIEKIDKIESNNQVANSETEKIYSYDYDSEYIYSAFLSQYNIDLNSIGYLHWWKFKSLFKGLNEDNLISKIIGYRSIDLSEIKDDEERDRYKKIREVYKIPNNKEKAEQEKINEIESILMNSKQ